MLILKHKRFHQWALKEGVSDQALQEAVHEMDRGLLGAKLGHGLYKKRIARKGQGKRGGYRTLLAFSDGARSIFIYGFAKNERENIGRLEKEIFKRLALDLLSATDGGIGKLIQNGELIEVKHD